MNVARWPVYRWEKRPHTHCTGGWVNAWAGLDGSGNSWPHRDPIPRPSAPWPEAILPAPSRSTLNFKYLHKKEHASVIGTFRCVLFLRKIAEDWQCTYQLRRLHVTSVYYVFWVCVCSICYPARKAHVPYYIVICSLSGSYFSHYLTNRMIFGRKFLNIKCVCFDFLQKFCLKHFLF